MADNGWMERIRWIEGKLSENGIPCERIFREADAALYVPSIEKNEWIIQTCAAEGFPPVRTGRRMYIGTAYTRHADAESALEILLIWYRKNGRAAM